MSNLSRLESCFRETLGLPPDAPVAGLRYRDDPVWDSVAHMRLVAAIESAFDIAFSTDQILDMSSFAVACTLLKSHGISLETL